MDPVNLPKGQSQEYNFNGKPDNKPGIYVQKESGAQFITSPGTDGVIQADAAVKVGFEWTAPVPTMAELKEMHSKLLEDQLKAEEKSKAKVNVKE